MEEPGKNKEQRRIRREIIIIIALSVLAGLLFFFQTHISQWRVEAPFPNNLLIIALIGLNIILVLLLVFLILRNVVKLIFERKKRVLGSKLKTKLVLAFITLTLAPAILLFFIATYFVTSSIDNWFSDQVEHSMQESLGVAQIYYQNSSNNALHFARQISQSLGRQMPEKGKDLLLDSFLKTKREEYNLEALEIISHPAGKTLAVYGPNLPPASYPPLESKIVQDALRGKEITKIQSVGQGDLIRGVVPIYAPEDRRELMGVLVVDYFVPQSLVSRITQISRVFEEHKQLKMVKHPIRSSYLATLSLVTLLIIFSAIWFGLFLAKGITGPIQKLAEGTQKIIKGNLDFQIARTSEDEIGTLVDSFNQMTADLKGSKSQIEKANAELSRSNIELEQRRRYMEIVLRDVGAGVISIDTEGRLRTMNKSAETILGIRAESVLRKKYSECFQPEYQPLADELTQAGIRAESHSITRQVKLNVRSETLTVVVKIAILRDEEHRTLGMVVVLDDLTQLQKAQRAAAWREVARRIAHEIKNPLTPIQLSAQRLRKRYLNQFAENGAIFDECTKTIITQVEELKNLVNEFSSFARMPAANPSPNNLNEIVREAMVLHEEGHKQIQFSFAPDEQIPVFPLDREQIKRVLVNLLENAVAAVQAVCAESGEGRISVETHLDSLMNLARLEVADNGCGVSPEDKPLLFEPYFSTKASGTGLGLAIVNTIVSDHDGYIRVKDNPPRGTRFVIELPMKT